MSLEKYLNEVKARSEAATKSLVEDTEYGAVYTRQESEFERHARTDISVLLEMVEELLLQRNYIFQQHEYDFQEEKDQDWESFQSRIESLVPGGE